MIAACANKACTGYISDHTRTHIYINPHTHGVYCSDKCGPKHCVKVGTDSWICPGDGGHPLLTLLYEEGKLAWADLSADPPRLLCDAHARARPE